MADNPVGTARFFSRLSPDKPMDRTGCLIDKLYQLTLSPLPGISTGPPAMTLRATSTRIRLTAVAFALTALASTGCTSIKIPAHPFTKGGTGTYVGVDSTYRADSSMSEEVYHSVRRARAENGVVLQVVGDSTPALSLIHI